MASEPLQAVGRWVDYLNDPDNFLSITGSDVIDHLGDGQLPELQHDMVETVLAGDAQTGYVSDDVISGTPSQAMQEVTWNTDFVNLNDVTGAQQMMESLPLVITETDSDSDVTWQLGRDQKPTCIVTPSCGRRRRSKEMLPAPLGRRGVAFDAVDPSITRTGKKRRQGNHLWKFLFNLLLSGRYPRVIKWLDIDQGIFTFVDTRQTAALWGRSKNKPNMSFEHLARGMRHYYKEGIMKRVKGKRLVYQFCAEADIVWRTLYPSLYDVTSADNTLEPMEPM